MIQSNTASFKTLGVEPARRVSSVVRTASVLHERRVGQKGSRLSSLSRRAVSPRAPSFGVRAYVHG